jgi:hypothetical protein
MLVMMETGLYKGIDAIMKNWALACFDREMVQSDTETLRQRP